MKNLLPVLVLFAFWATTTAQTTAETCQAKGTSIFDALNSGSIGSITDQLSTEFTLLGYHGETALMVFEQLAVQFKAPFEQIQLVEEAYGEKRSTLVYSTQINRLGTRAVTLIFDQNQQLQSLEIQGVSSREERYDTYDNQEEKVRVVSERAMPTDFPDKGD